MAITSFDPRNPRIVPSHGVPQITNKYAEANSQSFKAGELVQMSSSTVTVTAAGDAPVMGVALKDGTSVSSGNVTVPVMIIKPDDEVYIQVAASGGAVEAANTTCKAGVAYDIQITSNHVTVNSSDTSNGKYVFIEPILDATGSATYWGRFKPYYLEAQAIAG